jgi:hypothetical protein
MFLIIGLGFLIVFNVYFINPKSILLVNPTSRKTSYLVYDSYINRKMKDNTKKCICVHTP